MSSRLPVLIVGAGPTGLMMACELARYKIPFRIIDKNREPITNSNATWIQTQTLEIFDRVGIVGDFLKRGNRCQLINLYSEGQSLLQLPLDTIDSAFKFILMLPQSMTEKILRDHLHSLKQTVEMSCELISTKQQDHSVISVVRHANGKEETITSDWLIACDGANSTVRSQCGIKFEGVELTEQFMVADATMRSYSSVSEVSVFFDKETIFAAFPMGSNKYRIFANLHQTSPRKLFVAEEVKEIVDERSSGEFHVETISWISPFWIHSRIINKLRHNAIFFAGDAAHIHSPVGGQGMNAGIQDAFNLAWKLALVVKGNANNSLLDSYHAERHPVVSQTVDKTERLTKMALFEKDFQPKLEEFCKKCVDANENSNKIAMELTQLNTEYRKSPIIDYKVKVNSNSPKQGERLPNVGLGNSDRLFDKLHTNQHIALFFSGESPQESELAEIKTMQKWMSETYPELVKPYLVTSMHLKKSADIIADRDTMIHHHFNIKSACLYIIRPDNFIGYYSDKFNQDEINRYFQLILR